MKNTLIIFLVFCFSGCAIVSISPEVSGIVVDSKGNPVKATVRVTHKKFTNHTKSVDTDSKGRFKLSKIRIWTPIPFSAIRIWSSVKVNASGYKPYEYEVEGFKNNSRVVELKKR